MSTNVTETLLAADCTTIASTATVGCAILSGSAQNYGTICSGTFLETSANYGTGNYVIFSGDSVNNGFVSGEVFFYDNTVNCGCVLGAALFTDNSSNEHPISGTVTFTGSSVNNSEVCGDLTYSTFISNSGCFCVTTVFSSTCNYFIQSQGWDNMPEPYDAECQICVTTYDPVSKCCFILDFSNLTTDPSFCGETGCWYNLHLGCSGYIYVSGGLMNDGWFDFRKSTHLFCSCDVYGTCQVVVGEDECLMPIYGDCCYLMYTQYYYIPTIESVYISGGTFANQVNKYVPNTCPPQFCCYSCYPGGLP
jgi:hypothetical protein